MLSYFTNRFKQACRVRCLIVLAGLSVVLPVSAQQALAADNESSVSSTPRILSLAQAIALAQRQDPWLTGNRYQQQALEADSVAAGSLPDPMLSLSAANLPVDSFDIGQEAMTQFKVGISQPLARGDSLRLRRERLQLLAAQHPLQRQDRRAKVALAVTQLWLDAYRARESIALIERDRALFEQLADIATAQYRSALGGARQQDVVRAQVELTRIEDRLTQLHQHYDDAKAGLGEWLGVWLDEGLGEGLGGGVGGGVGEWPAEGNATPGAGMSESTGFRLASELPLLSLPDGISTTTAPNPSQLAQLLVQHPAIRAIEQRIDAGQTQVELAQQSYKPQWSVNAAYAYRDDDPMGRDRADLFSVGVTLDLPFFSDRRQDQQVRAAKAGAEALKTDKLLALRKMLAEVESARARLQRLDRRLALYDRQLLVQMAQQSEAALLAYSNDDGDFAEAVRARIAELDARIEALEITTARQKTIAQLNYLFSQSESVIENESVIEGESLTESEAIPERTGLDPATPREGED